jgi:hypothetical protein
VSTTEQRGGLRSAQLYRAGQGSRSYRSYEPTLPPDGIGRRIDRPETVRGVLHMGNERGQWECRSGEGQDRARPPRHRTPPKLISMPTALTHPVSTDSPLTSSVRRAEQAVCDPLPRATRPPVIMPGDVLVSRPTARAGVYDISVAPGMARIRNARYEEAMETGRRLARGLAVDGWFTCDHTHFVHIARHRP